MIDNKGWAEVSPSPPSPPPPIPLAVVFVVVVECLLPHIPPILLPAVFFFPSPLDFLRRFTSSSSLFSFSSSFFVVFVVFIPMADRGVVYMYVLETFGGFGGFVATGIGRFEHVQRR